MSDTKQTVPGDLFIGGAVDLVEISAPSTPSALHMRLYAKSNGSSTPNHRTQIIYKDSSGNEIVIAESAAT